MGEAKNKQKRLRELGLGTHVQAADIDASIEDFEKWVESGRIDGFVQIGKLNTGVPGVWTVKMWTMGLEKAEIFDMICQMRRSMIDTMGMEDLTVPADKPKNPPKNAN